jgi:hypothetical protein
MARTCRTRVLKRCSRERKARRYHLSAPDRFLPDTSRLTEHFLTNVIGNPLDTTVALAHIVFGGVLENAIRG